MDTEKTRIVQICPTKIWIENGICGERHVMVQHESCAPFTYATFNYNYAYTDNSGTLNAAEDLAVRLGTAKPIEHRQREMKFPTLDDLRHQLFVTQQLIEIKEKSI
jgi:hypothetical protein